MREELIEEPRSCPKKEENSVVSCGQSKENAGNEKNVNASREKIIAVFELVCLPVVVLSVFLVSGRINIFFILCNSCVDFSLCFFRVSRLFVPVIFSRF